MEYLMCKYLSQTHTVNNHMNQSILNEYGSDLLPRRILRKKKTAIESMIGYGKIG